ncbi:MAG: hypothetical protein EON54_03845 [Alcaligenaceae bacterium]|nr:MAG: hypothetical protein EON54_03845 [Alcaligenaceae bacterium]
MSKPSNPMERVLVRFLGSWLLDETIYSLSLYRFPWGMYQADLYILHPDGSLNMYTAPRFYDSDEIAIEQEGLYLAGYVQAMGHDPMKAIRLQDSSGAGPMETADIEAWFLTRRVLEKASG